MKPVEDAEANYLRQERGVMIFFDKLADGKGEMTLKAKASDTDEALLIAAIATLNVLAEKQGLVSQGTESSPRDEKLGGK